MTSKLKFLVAASTLPAVIMNASSAYAAGTAVGTDINNQVSVAYQVGGVNQTAATDSDVFKVDRKLIFSVAEQTVGTTTVYPNSQDAIVAYTVTNSSNDVVDFAVTAANITGGSAPRGTDNIDASNLEICVDADGNGTCSGTGAESWGASGVIDNLVADGNRIVFVRGDFASTVTNGQIAGVRLTATAHVGGGAGLGTQYSTTATAGTPEFVATDITANTTGVETIFAEVVGTNDDTVARNGVVSTLDDYTVSAAALTVNKISRVVSDGVSLTNPKAIPGAVVEYCIVVSNAAGAATATGVNVSDDLSIASLADISYDNTFQAKLDGTAVNLTTNTCTPGTVNATYSGGANGIVSGTLTNIAAGETRTLVFRVTID